MKHSVLLLIDAIINLLLGVLLLFFPAGLAHWLGIPPAEVVFYPSMLGAVLFGIGLALLIERYKPSAGVVGLGLEGAIAINLCGALALAAWLLFGNLEIPRRGYLFLWGLDLLLLAVSSAELVARRRKG